MTIIDYFRYTDLTDNTSDKFNGAAIIDERGKEIPITETMIQHVLTTLEEPEPSPHSIGRVINGQ